MVGGDGFWQPLPGTSGGGGGALDLLHVRDEKASGTAGGTFTSGAWQTRTLNTVKTNEISGASLAENAITLPTGTFEIDAVAPAQYVNAHQARLYDVTGVTVLLYGTNSYAGAASGADLTTSLVRGRFTLGTASTVRLEHRCGTTNATNGFGIATSFGGPEVFADVRIHKIS